MASTFREIKAWEYAHKFVLRVYAIVNTFPEFEKYALQSQFLRAAVSIPANIAEGYKKLGRADKLRFMNIAQGSLEECRYYIILSADLQYITKEEYNELNDLIEKASWFLNAYAGGIANNNAVKDLTIEH